MCRWPPLGLSALPLLLLLLLWAPGGSAERLLVVLYVRRATPFMHEVSTGLQSLTAHPGHRVHFERRCAEGLDRRYAARWCPSGRGDRHLCAGALRARCRRMSCTALLYVESDVLVARPDHLVDRLLAARPRESFLRPETVTGQLGGRVLFLRSEVLLRLAKAVPLWEVMRTSSWARRHQRIVLVPQSAGVRRLNCANVRVDRARPELWQVFDNPSLWEARYLHKDYHRQLSDSGEPPPKQPCRDVFQLALFSRQFCADLVAEVESFGLWSLGASHKGRRTGADHRRVEEDLLYPTVDVLLWQLDFHFEYLWILRRFLLPLQRRLFAGYVAPPYSIINFVARYRLGEQTALKPHLDEAQVSLNVALSDPRRQYRGGGTRFGRYNCTVTDLEPGLGLFHPAAPTHVHEGVELASGTRYILVSFLDGDKYQRLFGDPFRPGSGYDPNRTCLRVPANVSVAGW